MTKPINEAADKLREHLVRGIGRPLIHVPLLDEALNREREGAIYRILMFIDDEPFFPNSDGPHLGNAAAFRDYHRRIVGLINQVLKNG